MKVDFDVFYSKTPLGSLKIVTEREYLVGVSFVEYPEIKFPKSAFQEAIASQITEYFSLKRKLFQIPLLFIGTPFQKRVWTALNNIPFGTLTTYKKIAEIVGCPRGFRAVGQAIHRNPIAIVVPCHRVVGQDGSLTGYASGLNRKGYLIELERKFNLTSQ